MSRSNATYLTNIYSHLMLYIYAVYIFVLVYPWSSEIAYQAMIYMFRTYYVESQIYALDCSYSRSSQYIIIFLFEDDIIFFLLWLIIFSPICKIRNIDSPFGFSSTCTIVQHTPRMCSARKEIPPKYLHIFLFACK